MPAQNVIGQSEALADAWRLMRHGACAEALAASRVAYARAMQAKQEDAMATSASLMAWCSAKLGLVENGLECAVAARRLWTRLGNGAEQARAEAIEAFLLLDIGMSDDAFETASEAVALAEQAGDAQVLAFVCNVKALVLTICREPSLGIVVMEHAVGLAREAADGPTLAFGLLNLGFCQIKLADEAEQKGNAGLTGQWLDKAIDTTDAAIAVAEACGDRWPLRVGLVNNAEFRARRGELDGALTYLARAEAIGDDPGTSLNIHYLYTLGDILMRRGDLEGARSACTQALSMAEASRQTDHQVNALERLGDIHEALGDFAAALAMHKRFHQAYVTQSGEAVQRRARVAEIRFGSERWRARADELAGQAMMDPLTGVANRRAFDAMLGRLEGHKVAIGILDLDMSGGFIASCRNPVRASYVQQHAALGGISLALKLGEAIIAAEPKGGSKVIDAIVEATGGVILARGLVTKKDVVYTKEAFDIGTMTLGEGNELATLHIMNEYMAVDDAGGTRRATFPDVITTLDAAGTPLSVGQVREGMYIFVLHVEKSVIPLASSVLDPSVYPSVEKAMGIEIAKYALNLGRRERD